MMTGSSSVDSDARTILDCHKVKVPILPADFSGFNDFLETDHINTICNSGLCPNRPECFKNKTVAFLILGDVCSRSCGFCGVSSGQPLEVDPAEPERITKAVEKLNLNYVVITSVTRDDLPDGGASQFVAVIDMIKQKGVIDVEVLIPDFNFNISALNQVIDASPKVINHNIECSRSVFPGLRPQGNYSKSLHLLRHIADTKACLVKSGFMVGVGETLEDIKQTLNDLNDAGVEIVTIGQYLPPTSNDYPLRKMYDDTEFADIQKMAKSIGFRFVFAGKNVRSSYHAGAITGKQLSGKQLSGKQLSGKQLSDNQKTYKLHRNNITQ